MKFSKVAAYAAVAAVLGSAHTLSAQEREKQAPPAKQEKAAQPQQRAPEPARQAAPQSARPAQQPAQKAQQPAQRAQPQQRAQQPTQKPQPQQRAPQPAQKAQQPVQRAQPQQRAQETKPAPQREAQQNAHQPAQREKSQPAQQAKSSYAPPQRSTQQARTWQQKGGWKAQGGWQGGANFQAARASNWSSEHRGWGQRGGYGGYFIPTASFGLYFGAGHQFHIGVQPYIVNGYPEFQYGGYTFMMVDPWPADWSMDWYQTDPLYIAYDNGYYLYDQYHPGEAVAVAVMTQ